VDGFVRVAVKDLGPGIRAERPGQLFQPFYTTKDSGMGMGLAVSSAIVKEHGGRIWAENNPEGGACFYFTLPVPQDASEGKLHIYY
jgi:two-component system sensor kinase FixL